MKKKIIRVTTVPASFNLLNGQLRFLNKYFDITGVSSPIENHIDEVSKREGIHIHPIEIARQISPIKDLKSLWNLYWFFKKENPYVVHSMTPKAGLLSMIAAYTAGVPHRIHTFTGLIFPTKKGFMQKVLILTDRVLCFCATKIFPEGKGVKSDLIKYKITSKPLKVIANGNINGIDIDHFSPHHFDSNFKKNLKKELQINPDDFVFIFVGRLVGDKGINELIEAFVKLNQSITNTKLLLVGDFEKKLDPLKEKTTHEILFNKNIVYTKWVNDVRPYLSIANVLTFPSYREGFPNVVLQAGAMGLPSIVTDISGSNEIIKEGENGTIIPPKNVNLLYRKMVEFYKSELVYDTKICREMIISRYNKHIVWESILRAYQNL